MKDNVIHIKDAKDTVDKATAEWRDLLILTATHQPKANIANALAALRHAPEWKDVLAYDEFKLVTIAKKQPPWGVRRREIGPTQTTRSPPNGYSTNALT